MYEKLAFLWGMPRSGTSWISQIIASNPDVRYRQSPMFSWEFKNALDMESTRDEWEAVLHGAYRSGDEFMTQSFRQESGQYPVFRKRCASPQWLVVKFDRFHNLTRRVLDLFPDAKNLAVVRHPCGAIHSWLTGGPKEFPEGADPLEHWRTGAIKKKDFGDFFGFHDWCAVTRMHQELAGQFPERFMVVRYEDVVTRPREEARRIFDFLGLEWGSQTVRFLEASHQRHDSSPYAVFKDPAVKDRWRSELQPEIRDAIYEALHGSDLEHFLSD